MDKFVITGGCRLQGRLAIHGAKNSILPILAASLLNSSRKEILLKKAPDLYDVKNMLEALASLGAKVKSAGGEIIIRTDGVDRCHVPDELMREMRSSIFLMGPLLGRLGKVRVSYPGGCAIGPRPINLHLKGLEALGARIEENGSYIELRGRLSGAEIKLDYPSVGATENLVLAAVLARGKTVIHNAAREPEIVDLQNFVNKLGARVTGAGSSTITIYGVKELGGGSYRVYPDRIVTGTYLIAAAITGSELVLEGVIPEHSAALIGLLRACGAEIEISEDSIYIRGGMLKAVPVIHTRPYPGFPTDLQAPMTALLCLARGKSSIVENIFKGRNRHLPELRKMGARISLQGARMVIDGVSSLTGAAVEATDLRAGAALTLAGLAAQGQTVVSGIHYIDRGYENLSLNLRRLGGRITRVRAAEGMAL